MLKNFWKNFSVQVESKSFYFADAGVICYVCEHANRGT